MKNRLILASSLLLILTATFGSTTYAEEPGQTRAEFKTKVTTQA